jgi:Zn-dependent protease
MEKILGYVIQFGVILFALSIHEASHAWMANRFGDPTAKDQGRITLNPLAHIDPIGTVIFPIILAIAHQPVFGWAKPVMVNPYNLRDPKRDNLYISAAGPGSNILMAIIGIIIFLMLKKLGIVNLQYEGGVLYTGGQVLVLTYILLYFIQINVILAIFNLLPIPPLDGSGILEGLLHGEALYQYRKIRPYGFVILILLIYLNILRYIAEPVFNIVFSILGG